MKREKTSPWKKYHPHEIKRYFKIWWRLRSQKRYSEANRILMIYRYPPFWLPVIGLLILYGIFWSPFDNVTKSKAATPASFDNVTKSNIDWASVRKFVISSKAINLKK